MPISTQTHTPSLVLIGVEFLEVVGSLTDEFRAETCSVNLETSCRGDLQASQGFVDGSEHVLAALSGIHPKAAGGHSSREFISEG